jgi:hypothetical protein
MGDVTLVAEMRGIHQSGSPPTVWEGLRFAGQSNRK